MRHVLEISINGDSCVVDPRIDPAVGIDRVGRGRAKVGLLGDIGDGKYRMTACCIDLIGQELQRRSIPGNEHQTCSAFCSHPRGYQPNTAGRSGQNDDLFVQRFLLDFHLERSREKG
jgi:hypothetical protein